MQNPENPKGIIFDQGYRHYDGQIFGRAYAIGALVWDDIKRAFGFKRKTGYRIGIILLIIFQLFTAGFFLFSSQFIEQLLNQSNTEMPASLSNPFSTFLESVSQLVLIFSAVVAPGILCRDRQNNVFPLYLVRPIYLSDYLWSKFASIFLVLLIYVVAPALILFIGKAFLASNAIQYFAEHQSSLGALLLSGILIALFYASYSMGISSLTTSIGVAVGFIIGLVFLLGIVSGIYLLTTNESWVVIFNFGSVVYRLKDWIFFGQLQSFDVPIGNNEQTILVEALPIWAYWGVFVAVIMASWLIILAVYRREVNK